MTFAALLALFRDHWPKVIAAILVPVILGSIAMVIAKRERGEVRLEEQQVERGRQEAIIETDRKVIQNVEAYRNAVEHHDAGELARVRNSADRCTRDPSVCE